jgi:multidrug efflux pump subunit AcrB
MVFAAIALLGAVTFFKLNLDMLPDIEPPAVSVIIPYPGASAMDVESEVTKYLEDKLSTTPNLDKLESKSKDNISIVNCIFDWGTDLDEAVNDIREKIDLSKPDLAEGAKEPFIFKFSSSMVPVLVVTVTAKESAPDLYRIVDKQLADPLKRIPGVGAILYEGGIERQIDVHFNRAALEGYHLSVQQIRNVLRAENLNLPAGTVKVGTKELQIRVDGRFRDVTEIANIVIGSKGDALIRLRDVAEVNDAHEEPTQWGWGGGIPGIVMIIQKQSGANSVNVINALKERLATLTAEVPTDIEVHTILDTSDHIYAMIKNLTESALLGGTLVIIICFLFLRRLRTSLVVTLAIPLSMVAAFIGLFFMGYTLNVISLMSLAIAVGMVVDDAIVVLENVVRHVDEGSDPVSAAVAGASEVGMAVAAATLTIVAVFAPLLLVKGIAGIIFSQMAFMILVTIMASLFVSLSILQIGETPLTTLTGQTVKLRNVAAIEETFGPVEIDRKNRVRVTRIQAGVQGRVLGDIVRDIRGQMSSLEVPPGISIEWGGEVEEQRKAFRDLSLLLILGVVLVYMVMAGQFEDFTDPFIIMFSVPFAFVGVIWAFALTATPLNLMSFIGIIMLMGLVVKNAIVLVDYTKQLREREMNLYEAVITGGKTRLRPVLMTSLTTIFGMVPLALSRGEGSEVWNALGITVIGGLSVSGLVTLVLVPLVYSLVHDHKQK